MPLPSTQRASFLVRLSAELENAGTSSRWVWRGELTHTLTGQSWRFVALVDLPRLLGAALPDPLQDVPDPSIGEP